MSSRNYYRYNNKSYNALEDLGDLFTSGKSIAGRVKQFVGSYGVSSSIEKTQEERDAESGIRVVGGTFRDSPVERQRRIQERNEQMARDYGDSAVNERMSNEDYAAMLKMKEQNNYNNNEFKTASMASSTEEEEAATGGSQPYMTMIPIPVPNDLLQANQIKHVILHPHSNSIYIKSSTTPAKSIFLKLSGNPHKDALNFIVKAADRGYPEAATNALATHLRNGVFSAAAMERVGGEEEEV